MGREYDNWYARRYQQARRRGSTIAQRVDAEPSRAHLLKLQAKGMGCTKVSRATGLRREHVAKIRKGNQARVHPDTQEKILAVKVPSKNVLHKRDIPNSNWIDSDEVHDRLDFLVERGVTLTAIAIALGVTRERVRKIRMQRWVFKETHNSILSLNLHTFVPDARRSSLEA